MPLVLKDAGLIEPEETEASQDTGIVDDENPPVLVLPPLLAGDTVSFSGLPAGYTVVLGGEEMPVPESGAFETASLTQDQYPLSLEIRDASGYAVATATTWGGDVWNYVTPMAEFMYSRLSGTMQARDILAGSPLEKLLKVLGSGLQGVKDLADHAVDLVDVDSCPAEYLPYLGNLLGFEFPYDLGEELQRNFVRSIVSMYRIKGTPAALKFVVNRLIAGNGFKLDILNEDIVAKTFDVSLTAEDGADSSGTLQAKINYLVALYSPAGMVPRLLVLYHATDEFDASRTNDSTHTTTEYTRWSFTLPGHTFNTVKPGGSVVSLNNLGQQKLTI